MSTQDAHELRVCVTITSSPELADTARRIGARIRGAWNDPARRVQIAWEPLSTFLEREPERGPGSVVLAVLGPNDRASIAYRIIDGVQCSLAPAVLLFDKLEDAHRELEGGGVLVNVWDMDPARLACTMHALALRQPIIERLDREIRIAAASQGGIEGEMSRLQDELHLAATVQREFIPAQPPEIPGVELGVVFRPAGYVSGDIFDVTALDDEHVGFFIADAVGHGVPAALLTLVICRSLRRTDVCGTGTRIVPPSEALARLNRELTDKPGPGHRFATAIYGVMNTRTRETTLAVAGHPAPIVARDGAVERLEASGPLLGIFPDADFSDVTFALDPGDLLLLFSDGFETAFHEQNDTDLCIPNRIYLDRLMELARCGTRGLHLRDAATRLERELDGQHGSLHQGDDVTALLIGPAREAVVRAHAA